jgi:hypothetical protein
MEFPQRSVAADLKALAIMTGESYDGGLRSRFRRMICLEYKRGEIDIEALVRPHVR